MASIDISEPHGVQQGQEQQLSPLLGQEKTLGVSLDTTKVRERKEQSVLAMKPVLVLSPALLCPHQPLTPSAQRNKGSSSGSSQTAGGTGKSGQDLMHWSLRARAVKTKLFQWCLFVPALLLLLLLSVTSESEGLSIPNFLLQRAVSRLQFDEDCDYSQQLYKHCRR